MTTTVSVATLRDGDVILEQGARSAVVGDAVVERGLVAVDLVVSGNTYHYDPSETVEVFSAVRRDPLAPAVPETADEVLADRDWPFRLPDEVAADAVADLLNRLTARHRA